MQNQKMLGMWILVLFATVTLFITIWLSQLRVDAKADEIAKNEQGIQSLREQVHAKDAKIAALNTQIRILQGQRGEGLTFCLREADRLYKVQEWDRAIEFYDAAIKTDPLSDKAWSGRGRALAGKGSHRDAAIMLRRAVEILEAQSDRNSKHRLLDAYFSLTLALQIIGQRQEEVAVLTKAIPLAKEFREEEFWHSLHFTRGIALEELYKRELGKDAEIAEVLRRKAVTDFEVAKRSPDAFLRREAEKRLMNLGTEVNPLDP